MQKTKLTLTIKCYLLHFKRACSLLIFRILHPKRYKIALDIAKKQLREAIDNHHEEIILYEYDK